MSSGDDIEAGRSTGAESTTELVGEKPTEGDVDFNGSDILYVRPYLGNPFRAVDHDANAVHGLGANAGAGVLGETTTGGVGVRGVAGDATGVGVRGENTVGTGVLGTSDGVGVQGTSTGASGVLGTSGDDAGVRGTSENAAGVHGVSDLSTGVLGTADQDAGVTGQSKSDSGVLGSGDRGAGGVFNVGPKSGVPVGDFHGTAVFGRSTLGRGAVLEAVSDPQAPVAQLGLTPHNQAGSPQLPKDGKPGDVFVVRQSEKGEPERADVQVWICLRGPSGGNNAFWGMVAFSATAFA